jgi:hypothetical protein
MLGGFFVLKFDQNTFDIHVIRLTQQDVIFADSRADADTAARHRGCVEFFDVHGSILNE